jgi:hypothetical protein
MWERQSRHEGSKKVQQKSTSGKSALGGHTSGSTRHSMQGAKTDCVISQANLHVLM